MRYLDDGTRFLKFDASVVPRRDINEPTRMRSLRLKGIPSGPRKRRRECERQRAAQKKEKQKARPVIALRTPFLT